MKLNNIFAAAFAAVAAFLTACQPVEEQLNYLEGITLGSTYITIAKGENSASTTMTIEDYNVSEDTIAYFKKLNEEYKKNGTTYYGRCKAEVKKRSLLRELERDSQKNNLKGDFSADNAKGEEIIEDDIQTQKSLARRMKKDK